VLERKTRLSNKFIDIGLSNFKNKYGIYGNGERHRESSLKPIRFHFKRFSTDNERNAELEKEKEAEERD